MLTFDAGAAGAGSGYPVKPKPFVAVPFCVWDNRQPGEMILCLPEAPKLAEARPLP